MQIGNDYKELCLNGCWTCKYVRIQTIYDEDEDGPLECHYNAPIIPGFPHVRPEDWCREYAFDGGKQILVGPKAGTRNRPNIEHHVD